MSATKHEDGRCVARNGGADSLKWSLLKECNMLPDVLEDNQVFSTINSGKDSAKDNYRMDNIIDSLLDLENSINIALDCADDKDMTKKFCDEYRGFAILNLMLIHSDLGCDESDFDELARYCDLAKYRIESVNSLFKEFTGIEDAVGQITDKTLQGATDQMSLYSLLVTKMVAIDSAFNEMALYLGVATLPLSLSRD